jgi:hypothetical protein
MPALSLAPLPPALILQRSRLREGLREGSLHTLQRTQAPVPAAIATQLAFGGIVFGA